MQHSIPSPDRPTAIAQALIRLRPHWPLFAVLGLFAAAACVVPTFAPIATTDDWAYTRSVQILVDEGELRIFPVVAATAVAQVLWAAPFYAVFDHGFGINVFGAVRLSTVVATALGGWGVYGLCRALGVGRGGSALGAAAYVFNPLTFALSFSFMTDAHFAAMLIGSALGYAKGLTADPTATGARWTLFGSALAAAAFLARQQGALIPLAVAGYLVLSGRARPNRTGVVALVQVAAIPAAVTVGYYLWLRYGNDVPAVQEEFFNEARAAGWSGTWALVRRIGFVAVVYAGAFALPIAATALPRVWRLARGTPHLGWVLFCVLEAVLLVGLTVEIVADRWMPYVGQFVGRGGIGPPDVLGSRPILLGTGVRQAITWACVTGAVVLGLALCRRVRPDAVRGSVGGADLARSRAVLLGAVAVWQLIGVLPPSFHYQDRGGSLDRYLLPLAPFCVCLLLWALRDAKPVRPLGWLVIAGFAAFSIAGTRDYLVYMRSVWSIAREANALGVPNERLDAGSGWDGYHLYELGMERGLGRARTAYGPWWVYFYAKATDSAYVVSATPRDGYVFVFERAYDSWLETEPTRLFLLRWAGVPPLTQIETAPPTGSPPSEPLPPPPGTTPEPVADRGWCSLYRGRAWDRCGLLPTPAAAP